MDHDFSNARYRRRGGTTTTSTGSWDWKRYYSNGNLRDKGDWTWNLVTGYHKSEMWDYPTKDFKKISATGGIVNTPMRSVIEYASLPAYAVQEHAVYADDNGWTNGRGVFGVQCPSHTLTIPQSYIDKAITSAFANVTITESDTLLWLGEMRESIEMFHSIGQSLLKLCRLTAAQRKAWFKGKLTVKEAQSLTLQLQYGIMPLEQQLEAWQEGLLKTLPAGRKTVRGYATYSATKDYETISPEQNWRIRHKVHEVLEANIRAGVLFDVQPPDQPEIAFFEPRAVLTTAYALARLSFVIDWFVNVGPTIAAWSPTVGTNILSSWVTIEETRTIWCTDVHEGVIDGTERSQQLSGSGTGYRQWVIKNRYPISTADRPILPSIVIDLNVSKVLSLILLLAKAK